ncbi:N-acetylglucosamine kinase [Micromonospora sagamiensis]|uniref:N-acetylglucosamine kinase-like BadF-type ATPase n=1 Tax=Micromonospora sagamiensis TaxID=47875 RepID=A0A562WDQ6_9ACTN|nr:BadF/BadG/BcrA/BcrD ATPase family protein [Micromonospora sagamiensis]TWJ28423.1 N-acetylglucosamine kinase-like BadF-type ATPase [Micromonospora sagamiensis]BCL12686.1 N-acetylglucosamine kinase [Micromonospora sagamiensis]
MSASVVVGLDVGGTSTRATVVTTTGERLGTGRAGGGNPTSHGADRAAAELRTALHAALAGTDPAGVTAGVIGLAGAGRLLADPAGRDAFDRAWHDVGLHCPYTVHSDALIAYASGSPDPDGTVLIAGTGAIAARVRGLRLDRVADGHGWLLGDAGSGFWLGREAVRRVLADLDRAHRPGPLGVRVLTELLGHAEIAPRPRDTVDALVQAVTRRPPVELARLAPLVVDAARRDEPTAVALVGEAAGHLAESASRIRPPGATEPLVLGGGLLTGDTPLASALQAELRRRWPEAPLRRAGDGAAAAAWLAARDLPGVTDPEALHGLLVDPGLPLL